MLASATAAAARLGSHLPTDIVLGLLHLNPVLLPSAATPASWHAEERMSSPCSPTRRPTQPRVQLGRRLRAARPG